LPKHHPDIALCHQSMGEFYAGKREEINKAIEHFQTALSIYETQPEFNCKQLEIIRSKLTDLNNQKT
jgi:hypothetical protein